MKKNLGSQTLTIKKTTISNLSLNKNLGGVFTNITSKVCSLQNL